MTHPPFPILTTARLTLRQVSLNDAEHIFALRSDPAVNQYLDRQPSTSIDDAILFINRVTENINSQEALYWAVTLTENNTFAGTIGLFGFTAEQSCEMGYELLTPFQGKGIMKEAAAGVITYAFQTLQVQAIEAFTHKNNQPSVHLLTQLGFHPSTDPDKMEPDVAVYILDNNQHF